jgi:hypothetical protein
MTSLTSLRVTDVYADWRLVYCLMKVGGSGDWVVDCRGKGMLHSTLYLP